MRIFLLLCICVTNMYAQNKNEIIDKHIRAMGGKQNWEKIKNIFFVSETKEPAQTLVETQYVVPLKNIRIDYKITSRDATLNNKKFFVVANDKSGWKYLPENMRDTVLPLSIEECNYFTSLYLHTFPLLASDSAKEKSTYMGTEYFDDNNYHKLMYRKNNLEYQYLYLDMETYLIKKIVNISPHSESEITLNDYKMVQNLIHIPHKIDNNGSISTINEIKFNTTFEDKIFNYTPKK